MMTIIFYAEMSTQDFLLPNSSAFEVLILLTEICEDPGRVILYAHVACNEQSKIMQVF